MPKRPVDADPSINVQSLLQSFCLDVAESGRLRLSEAAGAKREPNARGGWVIGGTGARPESRGTA